MKAKLLDAQYVKEAKSILFHLKGPKGEFRSQTHRDEIGKFGKRTEDEIIEAMEKYVKTLKEIYKDKEVDVVNDKE